MAFLDRLKNLFKSEDKEAETPSQDAKKAKKEAKKTAKKEKSSKKEKKSEDRRENMTLLNNDENLLTRDDIDKSFTEAIIAAGAPTVEHCFQCGTCGGGCPSGRRTPYRVRQIVRKALLGLKDEVISDPALWMCTTCYTCQERCPRSVEIVDIIKIARNEAAKAGFMAPAHKATGQFVSMTGHGVPINDATKALRTKIGLSELPPTTHSYPEALEEVQNIIKKTGFDNLIGLNWNTGKVE